MTDADIRGAREGHGPCRPTSVTVTLLEVAAGAAGILVGLLVARAALTLVLNAAFARGPTVPRGSIKIRER